MEEYPDAVGGDLSKLDGEKMKIVMTTTIYPPDIGGPATYGYQVAQRLRERGHEVKVLSTSPNADATDDVFVVPKKLGLRFIGFLWHQFQVFFTLLRLLKNADAVYALNPVFLGLISIWAGRLRRRSVVLRFVGDKVWEKAFSQGKTNMPLEDFYKSPRTGVGARFLYAIQKSVLNGVDKVIVPSYFLKDVLVNCYQTDPQKIKVIRNAVALEGCRGSLPESGSLRIITVGRLIRHKRVDRILKAISELAQEFPDVELLVVGEGPEGSELKKLSQELKIEEQVRFLGSLGHEDVMKLLKGSDIFVLVSVYEGLPHAVIEAMACGVPVIATNIKGTNEVVKDNDTGLLVAVEDDGKELATKIAHLLRDKELRNRLSRNAYEAIKQDFVWEKTLNLLESELAETK